MIFTMEWKLLLGEIKVISYWEKTLKGESMETEM